MPGTTPLWAVEPISDGWAGASPGAALGSPCLYDKSFISPGQPRRMGTSWYSSRQAWKVERHYAEGRLAHRHGAVLRLSVSLSLSRLPKNHLDENRQRQREGFALPNDMASSWRRTVWHDRKALCRCGGTNPLVSLHIRRILFIRASFPFIAGGTREAKADNMARQVGARRDVLSADADHYGLDATSACAHSHSLRQNTAHTFFFHG